MRSHRWPYGPCLNMGDQDLLARFIYKLCMYEHDAFDIRRIVETSCSKTDGRLDRHDTPYCGNENKSFFDGTFLVFFPYRMSFRDPCLPPRHVNPSSVPNAANRPQIVGIYK